LLETPEGPHHGTRRPGVATRGGYLMKRVAVWAFYGVGALAIAYLALYAYAMFSGRELQPGDPIHIFRKPDAPDYSWLSPLPRTAHTRLSRPA
jgi:hypothetical protein